MIDNIEKCIIVIKPPGNGYSIRWNNLEFSKRRILPVGRAKQNRNNVSAPLIMALDSSLHFDTITIVRSHKVRADKQQDNVSAL